jgi:spermidine synthase
VILLAPTIFLGAVFPLAGSIFKKDKKDIIGLVYSSDLFGAILGTLLAGFYLIPQLGARITVIFGALLNIISASIIMSKKQKLIPAVCLVLIIASSLNVASITNEEEPIIVPDPDYGEYQYYANSPYGIIKVKDDKLYIDGRMQCCWCYTDENSEVKMVNYSIEPILKYDPKNALNIGLGCGQTLSKIVEYGLFADVVEINWKVVEANQLLGNILDNPKVNLIIDDGLHYLRENKKKYDSILIDIENPKIAHSSGLYTVDAFILVNASLNEYGTFGLWNYNGNDRFLDILYYSLNEVFPFVYSRPGFFLATKSKLDLDEYEPTSGYEINTIDKNTLTDAYLSG